jgi:hypothetical protein
VKFVENFRDKPLVMESYKESYEKQAGREKGFPKVSCPWQTRFESREIEQSVHKAKGTQFSSGSTSIHC